MGEKFSIEFSHFGILVTDIDLMVGFYTRFLKFIVSDRAKEAGREIAFLTRTPREHHQLVMQSGRPANSFNMVQQISFRVDSLTTLRTLHAALAAEPVTVLGPVTHGNALSTYFLDPEGNRVELFIDTPWYVMQPIRLAVDLSLSEEEIWKRAEEHARRQPGFETRAEWEAEITRKLAAA